MSASRRSVLVIGGGVSGLTAAIRLRHHGVSVTLMERAKFPREKICGCCLGAAGVAALDSIGVGDGVRERGIATKELVGYLQTKRNRDDLNGIANSTCGPPIRIPIVPGVAISRSSLDSYLMQCAIDVGVDVRQPHEAQVVSSDSRDLIIRHRRVGESPVNGAPWSTTDEFSLAIIATGLTGVFQGKPDAADYHAKRSTEHVASRRWDLPWVEKPHGPLGAATHLPGDHPLAVAWQIDDREIQMICGDDGYVGLVRLPDGSIDIAAALPSRKYGISGIKSGEAILSRRTPSRRIAELLSSHPNLLASLDEVPDLKTVASPSQLLPGRLDELVRWLEEEATWMTAPPLRRTRRSGQGNAVAIGDCVRYVEPLTGEGMTWGIESGIAVADLWKEVAPKFSVTDFSTHWGKRLSSLQSRRRIICGGITGALRSRSVRQVTSMGLHQFAWLAGPITRGLATGPRFDATSVSQAS